MDPQPKKVYQEGEKAPGGITIENALNQDDGALPFGLFNPDTEGKLTWISNLGPSGDVISVFCFDHGDHTDREVRILKDLDEAKYVRDELVKNGWRKLIPPKIAFTVTSADGKQKPLNRKERRYLGRKINQAARRRDNDHDEPPSDPPEPIA